MRGGDGASEPDAAALLGTLEDHAAVYAAVVASALDAVIVVNEEGAVVTINPAAETTFGYRLDEAVGRSISDLIVPDQLRDAHEHGMGRYRATREPHVLGRRVEMDARHKNGRIIPVELAITEVALPSGRLFTANLRDLSAARSAALEIERQRDALYQSERLAAMGSLLAGVAHELNNPLSIVLGQSVLLREEIETGVDRGRASDRARKIEAAAERCARVVRSFLAIARQRKAEPRSVPVVPLLESSIELMLHGLQTNGIVVTRDYAASLPDIRADPDQVQNIVANLLVNAVQALQETPGHREIAIRAKVVPGDRMRIVVADNGPGIAPDMQERIFEPFVTTKPQGVGTGIGLSISRGLAETQGGTLVLVASDLGGAAFELSLPLAGGATARETVDLGAGSSTPETAGAGARAIVIDDEPEIAELLAEALIRAGYRCDVATSGREALVLIATHADDYDAVICDLRMPDIDGPSLFRWIETHHARLADRTVFVTGDALGPAAGRFLAASGRPVLEKPFSPAEIGRLVAGFRPSRA